jgi:predicted nucleotidyltransferase
MKRTPVKIDLPKDKIADFCRRHHIRKLAVFGSALREDFRPDSDFRRSGGVLSGAHA